MEEFIQSVSDFFQKEDVLETIFLFIQEHYELAIVAMAAVFILVLSLSTILQRLQKKGRIALVPIYRFVVIFKAIGIKPWCALLMLVPGVNLIMRVVFYVVLVRKFNRNYFFVPLLVLLPLIALPVVAFGDGQYMHIKRDKRQKETKKRIKESVSVVKPNVQEKPKTEERPVAEKKSPKKHLLKKRMFKKKAVETRKVVEDSFEEEVVEVLSMAEVREKRAEARAEKAGVKTQMPTMQQSSQTAKRPQVKDAMPEMKSGPIGQRAKMEKDGTVMSEYERLLREQKLRQQRLQQTRRAMAQPSKATGMIVRKPAVNPVAKRPVSTSKPVVDGIRSVASPKTSTRRNLKIQ